MAAAKRVLRYLCSTPGMGLVLGGRRPVVLTGHADASWAGDQATQRSSQGYTFSLGSGSVSWRSTRSSSVLSSSCEAEIYAGAMAAQELRWLTYLLTDLGEQPRSPPVLYVDNKAMLALCREHRLEHRTKHIALRYFLARELQQRGQLRLAYVASEANTADIFTKALAPDCVGFAICILILASSTLFILLNFNTSRSFFRDSTTLTPLSAPVPVRLADPSRGPVLARSSTVLPCPQVPSGSLSGLHLPSFSTNLVSTSAVKDAMVTTTTLGGQRVSICTCTRTVRHLATFTRKPGSSLYTLATEPPQLAASAQVSASGPVAPSCSCRLLSHQTLLWHHRLGHPSLPRLRGMHSCLLVSGLPRSLPPLPPSPAPPCLPCVEGRQHTAPHSSSFPPMTAPLQTLHMGVDLQLCERFCQDLPVLRLHSDRGGEFSPHQLRERFARRTRLRSGAAVAGVSAAGDTGAGGVGVPAGAGGTRGAAAADPVGARTRGIGAAGTGSVLGAGAGGAGAGDHAEPEGAGVGGTGAGGAGTGGAGPGDPGARVGGTGAVGAGVGGVGAGDTGTVDPKARGAAAGGAVSSGLGAGDTVRPRPYFVPLLQQPASPLPTPSPYIEQTGGLTSRRELESPPASPVCALRTGRRVPRPRPPPVPGTHAMALRPSSIPPPP
ncbi:unnamed protein product [Closterium sp. NIES-54]